MIKSKKISKESKELWKSLNRRTKLKNRKGVEIFSNAIES